MASSSFRPYPPGAPPGRGKAQPVKGIADFLQAHDKLRLLLPTATRLASLQSACSAALADVFTACSILQFEENQLLIGTPNSAVAAKLKQKLPKLQEVLIRQGWQVNAIRLKVQLGKSIEKSMSSKHLALSGQAVAAFSELEKQLEASDRNTALKAALHAMLERHRHHS